MIIITLNRSHYNIFLKIPADMQDFLVIGGECASSSQAILKTGRKSVKTRLLRLQKMDFWLFCLNNRANIFPTTSTCGKALICGKLCGKCGKP
jgi:hypothetical protein